MINGDRPQARWYMQSVTMAGLTVLILFLLLSPFPLDPAVGFFVVLSILATLVPIRLARGVLSVSTAITIPAYLLYGPAVAMVSSVVGNALGNGLAQRRPLRIVSFNAGQLSLSLAAGHLAFVAAGGHVVQQTHLWSNFWPFVLFLLVYFVFNNGLVLAYFSLATGTVLRSLAEDTLPWSAFSYTVSTVVGYILLLSFTDRGYTGAVIVFASVLVFGYLMSLQLALQKAHSELSILYEAALNLNGTITLEEVFLLVHSTMKQLGPVEFSLLYLAEPDGETLVLREQVGCPQLDLPCHRIELGAGIIGGITSSGAPQVVNEPASDDRFLEASDPTGALLVVPLAVDNDVLGAMVAISNVGTFDDHHLRLVSILANLVGVAVQNAILYERTERLAVTDELTGLHNYRFFRTRLLEELRAARLHGSRVALIYLDLDGFKNVNDGYGHAWGDKVLASFAEVLRSVVRQSDTPVRYAGDEFAVILPDAGMEDAEIVIERLQSKLQSTTFTIGTGNQVSLSVSCGSAVYPDGAATADELIALADEAMYARKTQSRVS